MRINVFFGVLFCLLVPAINILAQTATTPGTTTPPADTAPAATTPSPASPGTAATPPAALTPEEQKALDQDNKRFDYVKKTLLYGANNDRKNAIIMIEALKDQNHKNTLYQEVLRIIRTEKESTLLITAINKAAEYKIDGAGEAALSVLENDSEDVRVAAIYAIRTLKDNTQATRLADELKKADFTKNSNYVEALLLTLGDFKHTALKDFLIEKYKDNETTQNFQIAILLFLGRSECIESRDFLMEVFKDENQDLTLRSYAVNALSKLNDKTTSPEILTMINSIEAMSFAERKKYYNFYMYCVTALTKLGDNAAFDKLMDSLRSDNVQVRARAIQLLGELKDQRSIDILRYKAEYDPEPRIQSAAKEALKELGVDLDAEKKDASK